MRVMQPPELLLRKARPLEAGFVTIEGAVFLGIDGDQVNPLVVEKCLHVRQVF